MKTVLGFCAAGLLLPGAALRASDPVMEALRNPSPLIQLKSAGGASPRIGVAPFLDKSDKKALSQVAGLWVAAQLVQSGGFTVYTPEKIKGALSKAGYHIEELADKEVAAALHALLGLDFLVQGQVSQDGKERYVKAEIWKLPSMEITPFLEARAAGSFSDFRKAVARSLLASLPVEGPVDELVPEVRALVERAVRAN